MLEEIEGDAQIQPVHAKGSSNELAQKPYRSIYDKNSGQRRQYFVPNVPITAKVSFLDYSPNIQIIKLTHGKYEWAVERRIDEFRLLAVEMVNYSTGRSSQGNWVDDANDNRKAPQFIVPSKVQWTAMNKQKRSAALESFLQQLLSSPEYRRCRALAEFVRVSSVSFVEGLGERQMREGPVRVRSGGRTHFNSWNTFCSDHLCGVAHFWYDCWLVLKDTYLVCASAETGNIEGVFLFDRHFRLSVDEAETEGKKHALLIANSQRKLVVELRTKRDRDGWRAAIGGVVSESAGVAFVQPVRFDSSFTQRQLVDATWFVDGETYFGAVADALYSARAEIFIGGWWLSPEVQLKRAAGVDRERYRLDAILKQRAEEGVRVFVLLFKEIPLTLPIDSEHSETVLTALHHNVKVLRHPDRLPGQGTLLWTHHEKLVCVDQALAFVGGIDLAWGRWDNARHSLTDTPARLSSSSTSQLYPTASLNNNNNEEVVVEQLWPGKDYANFVLEDFEDVDKPHQDQLDRDQSVRMPFHDVHAAVTGAAAADVARHFVQRWNAARIELFGDENDYPWLLPRAYDSIGMPANLGLPVSKCTTQLLRSVSGWSAGVDYIEDSIHQAYIDLIEKARHFIYIENQFFISQIGSDDVKNGIADALAKRILRAHRQSETLRVFIVLPLLPGFEARLDDSGGSALHTVLHWTFHSLSRGPNSLFTALASEIADLSQYVSICGLRSYSRLAGKLVTEQIYVHSKVLLVDDERCLIGSANLNDRSMLGDRDSELAVLFEDGQSEGGGGGFCASLRKRLMREHLGWTADRSDVDISDASTDAFFRHWQHRAQSNTDIYQTALEALPSDELATFGDVRERLRRSAAADDDGRTAALLDGVVGHLVAFPLRFLTHADLKPPIVSKEGIVPSAVFT